MTERGRLSQRAERNRSFDIGAAADDVVIGRARNRQPEQGVSAPTPDHDLQSKRCGNSCAAIC